MKEVSQVSDSVEEKALAKITMQRSTFRLPVLFQQRKEILLV